jgi:hypothetical protein
MMHRLAIQNHVAIAKLPEQSFRKQAVDDFGFLQAQDVGRFFFQIAFDDVDAGANRIDIPRGDTDGLRHMNMALYARSGRGKSVK